MPDYTLLLDIIEYLRETANDYNGLVDNEETEFSTYFQSLEVALGDLESELIEVGGIDSIPAGYKAMLVNALTNHDAIITNNQPGLDNWLADLLGRAGSESADDADGGDGIYTNGMVAVADGFEAEISQLKADYAALDFDDAAAVSAWEDAATQLLDDIESSELQNTTSEIKSATIAGIKDLANAVDADVMVGLSGRLDTILTELEDELPDSDSDNPDPDEEEEESEPIPSPEEEEEEEEGEDTLDDLLLQAEVTGFVARLSDLADDLESEGDSWTPAETLSWKEMLAEEYSELIYLPLETMPEALQDSLIDTLQNIDALLDAPVFEGLDNWTENLLARLGEISLDDDTVVPSDPIDPEIPAEPIPTPDSDDGIISMADDDVMDLNDFPVNAAVKGSALSNIGLFAQLGQFQNISDVSQVSETDLLTENSVLDDGIPDGEDLIYDVDFS